MQRERTHRLRRYAWWHYRFRIAGGVPPSHVIAVVDDDESTVRALTRLLRAAGFTAEPFLSGHEILDWDGVGTIACVVVEYHLADLTGIEVYQQLLARGVPCRAIFITADTELAHGGRALRRPYGTWLTKPVDDTALLATIRTALARREPPHGVVQSWIGDTESIVAALREGTRCTECIASASGVPPRRVAQEITRLSEALGVDVLCREARCRDCSEYRFVFRLPEKP